MAIPTFTQSRIYKSPTIQSQVRVGVELSYPVFSGNFHDDFNGLGLPDSEKWYYVHPSWGLLTQWVGALWVGTSSPGIAPSWVQSKHGLAFPRRLDTDWTFQIRAAAATITGYGAFIRICGRSFRDAEAIVGIHANTADGLVVYCPDGFTASVARWNNGADTSFNRYRVRYDASAQQYIVDIDADDDGTYEIGPFTVNAGGRYADAIVIGNSTAVQGLMGDFTEWHIDWVDVTGTAETVQIPDWAAPFERDSTYFSYLPTVIAGNVSVDKDNLVDGARIDLLNFSLDKRAEPRHSPYILTRFLNRRAFVEGRAGDGNGNWAPWELLFEGMCAEKEVELSEGRCILSIPMRDRWRSIADDKSVIACYSDAGGAIPGVAMNMTVAEIIEDLYQTECGMAAASHNVQATPNNTPRNYNVFRKSAQKAVKELCDETGLCCYVRKSDGRIEIEDWEWHNGDKPSYELSTAEEIMFLRWAERAFDVTSGEQLRIENTNIGDGGFSAVWPPHREPFYGRVDQGNAVTCQNGTDLAARPISSLRWWADNRKLCGIEVTAKAQFWVEHNLLVGVKDNRFLGIGRGTTIIPNAYAERYIIDGFEHSWVGDDVATTKIRLINPDFWRAIRESLRP